MLMQNIGMLDEIREMGTNLPMVVEEVEDKIGRLVNYMESYRSYPEVQRTCLHTISNVCKDVNVSNEVVRLCKAHISVIKTLQMYKDSDWKVCWFGCSAIWNMTRSEETRQMFPKGVPQLLIEIMKANTDNNKVVNVCVGSFSNMSLNGDFKQHIGKLNFVIPILKIVKTKVSDLSIARTSAGLIANLGVHTRLAEEVVEFGAIEILGMMLAQNFTNNIFRRNVVVALNNILTTEMSIRQSIRHTIVERLFEILESSFGQQSFEIQSLIINCLVVLGNENLETTTSFHLAAKHGYRDILTTIVREAFIEDMEIDFDMRDGSDKTMLDLALENDKASVASFLAENGACIEVEPMELVAPEIQNRVKEAKRRSQETRAEFSNVIEENSPFRNHDIDSLVLNDLSDYSLTVGIVRPKADSSLSGILANEL